MCSEALLPYLTFSLISISINMNSKIALISSTLGSLAVLSGYAQEKQLPNIIFILADDIGYTDFGCYGATKIKTPFVDKVASNGVRFTNTYSPASTSSPSRYALLTGEYAWRKNVGILPADAPLSIDPVKTTLPGFLRKAGYQTALIGKWHLGLGRKDVPVNFNQKINYGPLTVGFDYAYFFPATNDRVPCVFIENEQVDKLDLKDSIQVSYRHKVGSDYTGKENPDRLIIEPYMGHNGTIVNGISRIGWMAGGQAARWKDEEMATVLLNKVKSYINQQADKPFFLYYAPHNAHEPRVPSKAFRGKSSAGIYGDVIEEFDHCVGELVEVLKQKGIYENTIIIISSDNGPMIKEGYKDGALENINGHNPFGRLRGEKYSLYEGGTRVPFIFSWPRIIKQPFIQKQAYSYLDMLATLSGILHLPLSDSECNDSKNGAELFMNANASSYREFIIIQNNEGQIALRNGNWKYIPAYAQFGAELYNLETDPSEKNNIISNHPEQVKEFKIYMERNKLNN